MTEPARQCVGCLDTRQCWVCSGTGYLHPRGRRGPCTRCDATGVCHLCAAPAVPAQRATEERPAQASSL